MQAEPFVQGTVVEVDTAHGELMYGKIKSANVEEDFYVVEIFDLVTLPLTLELMPAGVPRKEIQVPAYRVAAV